MQARLSRRLLSDSSWSNSAVAIPDPRVFDLPERILQFGTGRFLRGFFDLFVDMALEKGLFDGRIVAVSSTGSGREDALGAQDGLYTLVLRGIQDGKRVERFRICGSISRSVSAQAAWPDVLALAHSSAVKAIVSNTTEVGIALDPADEPGLLPPRSFPGKLAAFLWERARAFDFDDAGGLTILPCELIEDNGAALKAVVLQLADRWRLDARFAAWVDSACTFCNTLVDRIVTGTPEEEEREALFRTLGFADSLLTVAEPYRLFAIEAPDALRANLPFLAADEGIILARDIKPYRVRKVRVLNGTHTVMTPTALLAGLTTVRGALEDEVLGRFIRRVMLDEIVPSLDVEGGRAFAEEVLDRFGNPFVEHLLMNITLQATMKMRHRVVPSILAYESATGRLPRLLLFGFACHLVFMRGTERDDSSILGRLFEKPYVIRDDRASEFFDRWRSVDAGSDDQLRVFVADIAADEGLWGVRLDAVPGFVSEVSGYVRAILEGGVRPRLAALLEEGA